MLKSGQVQGRKDYEDQGIGPRLQILQQTT